MKKNKFNWKIWIKKVGRVFLLGGVISLISYIQEVPIDSNSAIIITFALTLLEALRNYLKHK